eukprot:TRINITY_DN13207_c0_g1_i1.p1 TRINITY_DN13207_c0_g1~~TRINITY_DN13207_c0_g1_i1.p1  ORF type:complete len:325 (-),score=57.44 TRINITY_DN13207_c0_g1_i1:23-997(-)
MKLVNNITGFSKLNSEITLLNTEGLDSIYVDHYDGKDLSYVFDSDMPLIGIVNIVYSGGKSIVHNGIYLDVIGDIQMLVDERFVPFHQDRILLSEKGEIAGDCAYDFRFDKDRVYETYEGNNCNIRYYLKLIVKLTMVPDHTRRYYFHNHVKKDMAGANPSLRNEVGIKDILQLTYSFQHKYYYNDGVILGNVLFDKVGAEIDNMEISFVKVETCGTGSRKQITKVQLNTFELMEGSPVKGDIIPIRFHLDPLDLKPSVKNMENIFSLKYYIRLTITDSDKRKFYQQSSEIKILRSLSPSPMNQFNRATPRRLFKKKSKKEQGR